MQGCRQGGWTQEYLRDPLLPTTCLFISPVEQLAGVFWGKTWLAVWSSGQGKLSSICVAIDSQPTSPDLGLFMCWRTQWSLSGLPSSGSPLSVRHPSLLTMMIRLFWSSLQLLGVVTFSQPWKLEQGMNVHFPTCPRERDCWWVAPEGKGECLNLSLWGAGGLGRVYYTVLDRTQKSKERSLCGVGRCIPKALEHEEMLER